jgi:hypothetical protein
MRCPHPSWPPSSQRHGPDHDDAIPEDLRSPVGTARRAGPRDAAEECREDRFPPTLIAPSSSSALCECHTTRKTLPCLRFIDDAISISGQRHQEVAHLTEALEIRFACEWVPLSHRNNKVLLEELALNKPRRHFADRKYRNVECSRLKLGESVLPYLIRWPATPLGQELHQSDVDDRCARRSKASNRDVSSTAETASGAPMVNRRRDRAASNCWALAITAPALATISAIGAASSAARADGTTPFGVLRNSGSLRRRLSRPRP